MIKKLRNLLGVPALLIHELSHILAMVFLGVKGNGVEVVGDVSGFEVVVHYDTDSNIKKNIISIAPLIGFILWCVGIVLASGFLFLGLLLYTLFYVRVFFPSETDINVYNTPIEVVDENYEVPDLI